MIADIVLNLAYYLYISLLPYSFDVWDQTLTRLEFATSVVNLGVVQNGRPLAGEGLHRLFSTTCALSINLVRWKSVKLVHH